jgi:hypothetical protein
MTGSSIHFTQINLHHSKKALAVLARSMAVMHTGIAIIQRPWIVKCAIKKLGSCGKFYKADTTDEIKACIISKETDATVLPQFGCGDLAVIQLKIKKADGIDSDMTVGSLYLPHDSRDLPPQENVKRLATYVKDRGLELLLGCDAKSHHEVQGRTDINSRGESLLDFIMGTEIHILNKETEPTFLNSRKQEVTDITNCTLSVMNLVRDWRVSSKPSGSDHRQIHFTPHQIQLKER